MLIYGVELDDCLVMEIGKFAILWNCFEQSHCGYNCNPKRIKSVASYISINQGTQQELAGVFRERSNWFGQTISEYVEYSLHPPNSNGSTEDDRALMVDFIEQTGDNYNQIAGCLLTINRIRNNLVHGTKMIKSLNNQFSLFQAVNAVLESIGNK